MTADFAANYQANLRNRTLDACVATLAGIQIFSKPLDSRAATKMSGNDGQICNHKVLRNSIRARLSWSLKPGSSLKKSVPK